MGGMQDGEAIRNAVLRYDIRHPVVNDARMVLWRDLGIASWPTLVVVSPKGRAIFTVAGASRTRCTRKRSCGCVAVMWHSATSVASCSDWEGSNLQRVGCKQGLRPIVPTLPGSSCGRCNSVQSKSLQVVVSWHAVREFTRVRPGCRGGPEAEHR
jgi:hypothetical protein